MTYGYALNLNSQDAADFRRLIGPSRQAILPPIKVNPSPPTITTLVSTDPDAIVNGIRILPRRLTGSNTTFFDVDGDPHYEVVGCPQGSMWVDSGDLARPYYLTGGLSQSRRWPASWIFETDASRIDVYTRALSSTLPFRVWVLDKASGRFLPHSLTYQSDSVTVSGRYRIKVDFGSAEPRTIMYEPVDPYFGGVVIPPTATLQRPKRRRARFGVISDSTGAGANGVSVIETWVRWCAEYLDMDCINLSIGGSGYIATPTYISRLPDIIAANLDLLVIAGGQNDKATNTATDITTAAQTLIDAVKSNCPNTRIILGGIHMTSESYDVKNGPLESSLRTLAGTENVPFVSLRDPRNILATAAAWATATAYLAGDVVAYNDLTWVCVTNHTSSTWDSTKWRPTSFLTGTGKVTATVGYGNADVIMSSDGTHYSAAGHLTQALWYANEIIRKITDRT